MGIDAVAGEVSSMKNLVPTSNFVNKHTYYVKRMAEIEERGRRESRRPGALKREGVDGVFPKARCRQDGNEPFP